MFHNEPGNLFIWGLEGQKSRVTKTSVSMGLCTLVCTLVGAGFFSLLLLCRLVLIGAAHLKPVESKRVDIHVWSPAYQTYFKVV